MIEVRRAEPGDGDVLGEIHAASWEAAYAQFFDETFAAQGVQDRRTRWHERIDTATGTILIAEVDGRPLALSYSLPSQTRAGFAEIFSFYGHPDGWGTGVAGVLMTATFDRLRADRFSRVHLWTLRDTGRSRWFYAKCGFVASGETRMHDFGDGRPLEQVEYERTI